MARDVSFNGINNQQNGRNTKEPHIIATKTMSLDEATVKPRDCQKKKQWQWMKVRKEQATTESID
jgi:hypothetical protein